MRMAVAQVLAFTRNQLFAVVFDQGAVERVGSFGLDDADLENTGDQAEVVHLREPLGEGGAALARFPPGTMTCSGTCHSNCSTSSKAGSSGLRVDRD